MADQMREDLGALPGLSEKHMFGGLCFLLDGNMICGVHKDGAMFRVGKPAEAAALDIPGVVPLGFTGRRMGGMVEMDADGFADDAARTQISALARSHAQSLPAKEAKK
jgi:TfoX-like protein